MNTPRLPLVLLLCLACTTVDATIYKWRDADGQVHYSARLPAPDTPHTVLQSTQLNQLQAVTPLRSRSQGSDRWQSGRQQVYQYHGGHTTSSLHTCIARKRQALHLAQGKSSRRADISHIEEWLWRHCRGYANELRRIEQEAM